MVPDLLPLLSEVLSFRTMTNPQERLLLLGEVLLLQAIESFPEIYQPLGLAIDAADMLVMRSTQVIPSVLKSKIDALLERWEVPSPPSAAAQVSPQELSRLLRSVNTLVETLVRDTSRLSGLLQLGQAYSDIVERDNDKAGNLTLPRSVSQLLAEVLDLKEDMTVLDLTPDLGAALVGLVRHMRANHRDPNRVTFTYVADGVAARIIALHLLLNGVTNFKSQAVDLLTEPDLLFCDADRVVATPPVALRLRDTVGWPKDDHGLLFSPRKWPKTAEWHYILVGVSHLKAEGRAAFLTPHGPLFRTGAEAETRQDIAAAGWLRSVTALPSGLFAYTGIPFALSIFERPSAAKPAYTDIQFIDASQKGVRDGRLQTLPPDTVDLLAELIQGRTEHTQLSVVVPRLDVHANSDNWQPNQYFKHDLVEGRSLQDITLDLDQAFADVASAERRVLTAFAALPE